MALPASGLLSFSAIKAEFGLGNAFSAYRGKGLLPASGPMKFSQLYGASAAPVAAWARYMTITCGTLSNMFGWNSISSVGAVDGDVADPKSGVTRASYSVMATATQKVLYLFGDWRTDPLLKQGNLLIDGVKFPFTVSYQTSGFAATLLTVAGGLDNFSWSVGEHHTVALLPYPVTKKTKATAATGFFGYVGYNKSMQSGAMDVEPIPGLECIQIGVSTKQPVAAFKGNVVSQLQGRNWFFDGVKYVPSGIAYVSNGDTTNVTFAGSTVPVDWAVGSVHDFASEAEPTDWKVPILTTITSATSSGVTGYQLSRYADGTTIFTYGSNTRQPIPGIFFRGITSQGGTGKITFLFEGDVRAKLAGKKLILDGVERSYGPGTYSPSPEGWNWADYTTFEVTGFTQVWAASQKHSVMFI